MIKTFSLGTGITLRCIPDSRFKHGCLSIQFIRPGCREETSLNALLPAVLLRGSRSCPDLRHITLRLDELYGASIGTHVRRVGDWQTTGLYASFLEDRYAMEGDRVFAGVASFLKELLLEPCLEQGTFRADYVESEKTNLISTMEASRNDKQAWAMSQLLIRMCREDPYGIPRLGEPDWVREITAESLYRHYEKVLSQTPVELCYVGGVDPEQVACALRGLLDGVERNCGSLPEQTGFRAGPEGTYCETMEVNQAKLCLGFTCPVTIREKGFAAMQVLNLIYGGGMTSKLFMNVRERLSLCYAIGSSYHGSKGILTVYAGIDSQAEEVVLGEILRQLELCREGQITDEELDSAKQALRSSLMAVHDSPGALESYYSSGVLSGMALDTRQYMALVDQVTKEQVVELAAGIKLHTSYFLKVVEA